MLVHQRCEEMHGDVVLCELISIEHWLCSAPGDIAKSQIDVLAYTYLVRSRTVANICLRVTHRETRMTNAITFSEHWSIVGGVALM